MAWIDFSIMNWIGVLVAFLSTFAIGWVWYSPRGFFPLWARLGKLDPDQMKSANMGVAFGGSVLGNLLGVLLLALLVNALSVDTWAAGLAFGALIGFVFRGGAHAIHNGFAMRHPGVTAIDTAHDTFALAVAGAVLAIM